MFLLRANSTEKVLPFNWFWKLSREIFVTHVPMRSMYTTLPLMAKSPMPAAGSFTFFTEVMAGPSISIFPPLNRCDAAAANNSFSSLGSIPRMSNILAPVIFSFFRTLVSNPLLVPKKNWPHAFKQMYSPPSIGEVPIMTQCMVPFGKSRYTPLSICAASRIL